MLPVNIHIAFIEEMMENIYSLNSCLPILLVTKDEIYPFMQMLRHIVTFQSQSMHADKLTRIFFSPRWQHYITKLNAILFTACNNKNTFHI